MSLVDIDPDIPPFDIVSKVKFTSFPTERLWSRGAECCHSPVPLRPIGKRWWAGLCPTCGKVRFSGPPHVKRLDFSEKKIA